MDSMEEIYQNYAQLVYGFLLSRTRSPDLAEELTQETFYQAVQSAQRFRGDSSISTWLCGIAQNVLHTHLRKTQDHLPLDGVEEPATPALEESLSKEWDTMAVLKELHRLEEPMREVLYLRLMCSLSFRQIGEVMDRTENWARVTYFRGKERLIREVQKNEQV